MSDSFKKFFNKNQDKVNDRTFLDKILELVKEIYSLNPTSTSDELFTYASETLVNKTLEDLNQKIRDVHVYALDEIKGKFPQKLNNDINNEETENERTKETSKPNPK